MARAVFVCPKQTPTRSGMANTVGDCFLSSSGFLATTENNIERKMKRELHPCVYIMANKYNSVLYTGVMGNLFKRAMNIRKNWSAASQADIM
jgi:hypothetical protein